VIASDKNRTYSSQTFISPILTTVETVAETTTLLEQATRPLAKFKESCGTAPVSRTISHLQAVWLQMEASRSPVLSHDRLMPISRSRYTEIDAFLTNSSLRS